MDDAQQDQIPDEATLTPWLERLLGRSLAGVRIHSSAQAGELARRLGARAFAAGPNIYVRPEFLRPMTARGVALLAHELAHATEQTAAPALPAPTMTHLHTGGPPVAAGPSSAEAGSTAVQRALAAPDAEARATGVEQAALGALQGSKGAAKPPDPEVLAQKVYERILRDLIIERERVAGF